MYPKAKDLAVRTLLAEVRNLRVDGDELVGSYQSGFLVNPGAVMVMPPHREEGAEDRAPITSWSSRAKQFLDP